jgi:hypothetical protein
MAASKTRSPVKGATPVGGADTGAGLPAPFREIAEREEKKIYEIWVGYYRILTKKPLRTLKKLAEKQLDYDIWYNAPGTFAYVYLPLEGIRELLEEGETETVACLEPPLYRGLKAYATVTIRKSSFPDSEEDEREQEEEQEEDE